MTTVKGVLALLAMTGLGLGWAFFVVWLLGWMP